MGWTNAGGWSGRGWGKAAASGGAFHANAVHFDGSTYLTKSTAISGTGSTQGILSLWLKPSASDGSVRQIMKSNNDGDINIYLTGVDKIQVQFQASSGLPLLVTNNSTTNINSSSAWTHILASWNVATTYAKVLINGSDETNTSTNTNGTINYPDTLLSAFANGSGLVPYTGDVAEVYLNTATSFDLTVAGNVSKFISGGKPVSLGSDGSTPTGTAPSLYLGNAASTFQNNLGTGGNFTVAAGTVTSASTSPSD